MDIFDKVKKILYEKIKEIIHPTIDIEEYFKDVLVERPKDIKYGDLATNIALIFAKKINKSPFEMAKHLSESIYFPDGEISKIEPAYPGFINFRFSKKFINSELYKIIEYKSEYGTNQTGDGKKINIEFVSANPTGPLHVGHGRWAALGDCLANIFRANSYEVIKEYYINDAGSQVELFCKSVLARCKELLNLASEFPEGGYPGDYVYDIAKTLIEKKGKNYFLKLTDEIEKDICLESIEIMTNIIKDTLRMMGIEFDIWFKESDLYASGLFNDVVDSLEKNKFIYSKDGAKWFISSEYGDDKDRVVVRKNGEPTYFGADIAYLKNKLDRNYDKNIYIWGSDHHGDVMRLKAAAEVLEAGPGKVEVIIGQFINLIRGKRPVRMSKRKGIYFTLRDLLNELNRDVIRYFFVMNSFDTPIDFDIDLAKEKSMKNPVYYVQYAHARIESILKKAKENGIEIPSLDKINFNFISEPDEISLAKELIFYPYVIKKACQNRATHIITNYLENLAKLFHLFYTNCRVIGEDKNITNSRLSLILATKQVFKNALSILGVSAPKSM
jgi:arginyl-tRNA synthetase